MDSLNPHPGIARRPLLITGLLAAVWGAFSSFGIPGLTPAAGMAGGVASALLWTAVATPVARSLLRRRNSPGSRAPEAGALMAGFGGALLFGPGLYTHLSHLTPESYLGLMMSEDPGAAYVYFMVLNPLMEWVIIPAAVLLNWPWARRRAVALAGAVLYFLIRTWTYLYFGPTALSWQDNAGRTPTRAHLDQAQTWLNLDWQRTGLDLVVALSFIALVLLPRSTPPVRRPAEPRDVPVLAH